MTTHMYMYVYKNIKINMSSRLRIMPNGTSPKGLSTCKLSCVSFVLASQNIGGSRQLERDTFHEDGPHNDKRSPVISLR
jgi:hypothetical protein